jgi:molybdopterin-binding protein
MSSIVAKVTDIQSCDSLNIVKFRYHTDILSMMSLDIDEKIKKGSTVRLVVKPSHVAIAKGFNGEVSYSNILKTSVLSCKNGELLSSIKLNYFDTTLESIITLSSSKRLDLKDGDEVMVFIKASELSIAEVLDA